MSLAEVNPLSFIRTNKSEYGGKAARHCLWRVPWRHMDDSCSGGGGGGYWEYRREKK
jgi:hypothetical protein